MPKRCAAVIAAKGGYIRWPSGDSKKDCTVVVYEDVTVIEVNVIDIDITVVNGYTSTVTVTKTDKPTYTPSPGTYTNSAPASKKAVRVEVGSVKDAVAQLTLNPNQVNAAKGDRIEFVFLAKNHTLTQSSFDKPCTSNGGFDTGFNQLNPQNIDGKFVVPFTVSTEKPLWFYCRQGRSPSHCGKGMVFGVNPAGKMNQFIQNAIAQNGGTATSTTTSATTTPYPAATETKAPCKVTVGLNNGKTLLFDPPFLNKVKKGEKIIFDFRAKNHTLTKSSSDKPCTKLNANAFDTNFMNVNLADTPGAKAITFSVNTDALATFTVAKPMALLTVTASKGWSSVQTLIKIASMNFG